MSSSGRGLVRDHRGPHYDLGSVRKKVAGSAVVVPHRVDRYLRRIGLDRGAAFSIVEDLTPADFHKSMPHDARLDVWLDVYRPFSQGRRWYVKLTLHEDGERILLLSCSRDSQAH
jgi:hypothetical protein